MEHAIITDDRSLTVPEFCALERMSKSTYFKLKRAGLGPKEMHFPGMTFSTISAKARREWQKRNEARLNDKAMKLELERRKKRASDAVKIALSGSNHISTVRKAKSAARKKGARA